MTRLLLFLLIVGSIVLIRAHHLEVIQVVECTDGTFTELRSFERMREMNPTYVHSLICQHKEMPRYKFYDERSLRAHIKR